MEGDGLGVESGSADDFAAGVAGFGGVGYLEDCGDFAVDEAGWVGDEVTVVGAVAVFD